MPTTWTTTAESAAPTWSAIAESTAPTWTATSRSAATAVNGQVTGLLGPVTYSGGQVLVAGSAQIWNAQTEN